MSLLQTMRDYLKEGGNQSTGKETYKIHKECVEPPPVYYVATDLDCRKFQTVNCQDIDHYGKVYRKLAPEYFAWLRSRMLLARSAHKSGKFNDTDWNILRGRFNDLQEVAIRKFGKDVLEKALKSFDPRAYVIPTVAKNETVPAQHIYPGDQSYKFTQAVTHSALTKVNVIRDEAISKGWSEARLYQNQGCFKFPCGQDYGLICFLDNECETGTITKQSIEIKHGANSLRFYNTDAEQPWIRKVNNET